MFRRIWKTNRFSIELFVQQTYLYGDSGSYPHIFLNHDTPVWKPGYCVVQGISCVSPQPVNVDRSSASRRIHSMWHGDLHVYLSNRCFTLGTGFDCLSVNHRHAIMKAYKKQLLLSKNSSFKYIHRSGLSSRSGAALSGYLGQIV